MSNVNNKVRRYSLAHYLMGALPARLGDEMSSLALLLVGFEVTQNATLGSVVLAALTVSAALGGPLLGAVLDRSRWPGRVMVASLAFYAVGIAFLAATLGSAPLWLAVVVAWAVGLCMPAISGGWSSRLPSFIPKKKLTRASAIDALSFNIAGLVGPALAGVVAALFGAFWAVVAVVVLVLAALPMAWLLPVPVHQRVHNAPLRQDISAGFRVIFNNKKLLRITMVSVVSYMGIGMLWVVCPLVGQHLFGSAGYGGLLMSVLSVGALIATAAYAKWPTRYSPDVIAVGATCVLALAMVGLLFAHSIFMAIAAMLLAGLADGPQLAAVFAVRHREAPENLRSQVFTTGASLKITAAACGVALAGQLAAGSLQLTIAVAAIVQCVAVVAFVVLYRGKQK